MRNKILSIVAIITIPAFMAGSAFCEGGACHRGWGKESCKQNNEEMMRRLNLTPEQDKLLKDARKAGRARMEETGKALRAKKAELRAVLAKPGVTREDLEPIAGQIKAIQSQMVDRKIDGILKVKGILTPEQFQKLESLKEEHHKAGQMKHRGKE